jgi:hypothetical protein
MKQMYIVIGIFFLLLAGFGTSCAPSEEAKPGATDFRYVSYTIVEEKDVSYAAAVRKSVKIAVDEGRSKEEIEWVVRDVVKKITELQPVNAIMVFIYHRGDDYTGLARICIDWAPYGDWGRAKEAKTGHYEQHQYRYRVYDALYDYWDHANETPRQEQPHGVTELGSVKLELIGQKGVQKFEFLMFPSFDEVSAEDLAECLMLEWNEVDEVISFIFDDRDIAELYLTKWDDLGKMSKAELEALTDTAFPHLNAKYWKNRRIDRHWLEMLSHDRENRTIKKLELSLEGR